MAFAQPRTLLTSDSKVVNLWHFGYDLGTDHYVFAGTVPLTSAPTSYSLMSDVVNNRGVNNPINHLSMQSNLKALVPWRHTNGALITPKEDMPVPINVDDYWFGIAAIIPHPSPSVLQDFALAAHKEFTEQIPSDVSVANFIYELKDLRKMIPKFSKDLTKTASSNFLLYNFGIAPFVDDVKKMMNLADQVNKRLTYLMATLGKEQRVRFTRPIPEESWNGAAVIPYSMPDFNTVFGEFHIEFRRKNYTGTFRVSADFLQNLEGLDSQLGTMKAFAAAAGFNNPAAIVWEAIPFSFVVDWLFSFQKSLDYLAIQPFGGEWRITNVYHSLIEEWQYEVYQVGPTRSMAPFPDNVKEFLGSMTVQRYMRLSGLPVSSVLLCDGSLSPKQQMLSLALLNEFR
jgi:hypothetical protein